MFSQRFHVLSQFFMNYSQLLKLGLGEPYNVLEYVGGESASRHHLLHLRSSRDRRAYFQSCRGRNGRNLLFPGLPPCLAIQGAPSGSWATRVVVLRSPLEITRVARIVTVPFLIASASS